MSVQGLSPSRSRPRCRNGIAPTVARHSEPTDTTGTRHERCSSGSPVYSVVEPRVGWAPLRSPGLLWRGYRGRCYRRLGRLPGITAWCRPGDTSGLGRQPGPDLTPQGLPRRISDPAGGGPGSGIIGVQRAIADSRRGGPRRARARSVTAGGHLCRAAPRGPPSSVGSGTTVTCRWLPQLPPRRSLRHRGLRQRARPGWRPRCRRGLVLGRRSRTAGSQEAAVWRSWRCRGARCMSER